MVLQFTCNFYSITFFFLFLNYYSASAAAEFLKLEGYILVITNHSRVTFVNRLLFEVQELLFCGAYKLLELVFTVYKLFMRLFWRAYKHRATIVLIVLTRLVIRLGKNSITVIK